MKLILKQYFNRYAIYFLQVIEKETNCEYNDGLFDKKWSN